MLCQHAFPFGIGKSTANLIPTRIGGHLAATEQVSSSGVRT
jgi:hypothetical protein